MSITPKQALDWLFENQLATRNGLGLYKIVKPPKRDQLAHFVMAIKTLGAWAVESSTPAKVEVSCGCRDYELCFKLTDHT